VGFHVPLDISLGIAQDMLEMVVRDELIFIMSIPQEKTETSIELKTPKLKALEVWNGAFATFAHDWT
jgi:hypothetical protein